jgi:hypothetical protein
LLKSKQNSYYTNLKITAKGIDIVDTILQKYYEYLRGSPERDLQGSYDNISAIPDLFGKRKTTHFYIKKEQRNLKGL